MLLRFVNGSFAATPKNFSNEIKLNGMVLRSNHSKHGIYKIELLSSKTLINSNMISCNKRFEIKLYKNIFYTIRISKKGLVSLLLSVDTRFFSKNLKHCASYYDADRLKDTLINSFTKQLSDLPLGVTNSDTSEDEFCPNAVYTTAIEKQIFTLETCTDLRLNEAPKRTAQNYDLKRSVK